MKLNLTLIFTLVVVLISLYGLKSLNHGGFYTSHDGWHVIARQYHFHKALNDGQFPPRWSGDLLHNFGYPLFIFSYHFPWWIGELFLRLGSDIFSAIKLVFIITYTLSGIFMFFWMREKVGNLAGFVSAVIYLYTPYRFSNIFVRANLGEAVSFMFIPLIFWGMHKLSRGQLTHGIWIGAIGIAGAVLSHVIVVFLFLILLLLNTLNLIITCKDKQKFILGIVLMCLLGVGVSAYYLFPAIMNNSQTVFSGIYAQLYTNHFTSLTKLLYSPWGYGQIGTPGEMSRQVGLIIWGIVLFNISLLVWQAFKMKHYKFDRRLNLIIYLATFGVAIFLMLKSSLPVWKISSRLVLIDFPWRYLAVTTFSGSVLAGYLIYNVKTDWVKIGLSTLLLIGAFYTNRNHLRVNQYTDIPLSLYIDSEVSTNTDDEYLPKWVSREYTRKKIDPVLSEHAVINNYYQNSNSIRFGYLSPLPTQAKLFHMFFPGWKASIDDKNQEIAKGGEGEIVLNLPEGQHQVKLNYAGTNLMRFSNIITAISLLITISLIARFKKKGLII